MPTLKSTPIWLSLMGACAANPDVDGDGLTLQDEETLGTNPDNPDTDRDGLSDFMEVYEVGTNPTLADTDDDGADDGTEFDLCLDPKDKDSHPYTLGWPMVSCLEKASLMEGISPPLAEVGSRVRRTFLYDTENEIFDTYDLSKKPSLIGLLFLDKTGSMDGFVKDWVSGVGPFHQDLPPTWIRDAAISGNINISFVLKSVSGPQDYTYPPTSEDLTDFCTFKDFGCFADMSQELRQHAGFPPEETFDYDASWFLLDERMIVRSFIFQVGAAAPNAFEDVEEKLAIMLNITPP